MTNLEAYNYFESHKNQGVTLLFDGLNPLTLKEILDMVRLVAQFGDVNNIDPNEL